jgi:hypothetical protein
MARIQIKTLGTPSVEYNHQQMSILINNLKLALQRVDYAQESDAVARIAMNWMGI